MKSGKEALTTGLFQWKKDYNLGAMHFEEAAAKYKLAQIPAKEIEALKMSVECNIKLNDSWAVARNYEALIITWMENPSQNYPELLEMTRVSSQYFKVADSGVKCLQLYVKVAKFLISQKQYAPAEDLMIEALREAEEQQAPSTRSDILAQYTEVLVETQRYGKGAELYLTEIEKFKSEPLKHSLNQYALIVILMFVLQDEIIRANDETQNLIINVQNFHKSSEFKAADQILQAYEKGDQKLFDEAVMKPCVTNIYPPNICRTLRKIKVRVIVMGGQKQMNQVNQDVNAEEQRKKDLEKMIL